MNLLEKMRSDYIEQQRKIQIENKKRFDQAFEAFMRANQGKTVRELREEMLAVGPDDFRKSMNDHLYEIFSFEMGKRLDELAENQIIAALEREVEKWF